MHDIKIMAVDPSLTCSGWALFRVKDGQLLGVGKIKSLDANYIMSERLNDLQLKVAAAFDVAKLNKNDVLICEDATSNLDPSAAAKIEQVRGIFETLARTRGVIVPGRIHPRTVQYELMGLKGRQLKRTVVKSTAVDLVIKLYRSQLSAVGFDCEHECLAKHQDILDAILIGSLAVTKIKLADVTGKTMHECFAKPKRKFVGRFSVNRL